MKAFISHACLGGRGDVAPAIVKLGLDVKARVADGSFLEIDTCLGERVQPVCEITRVL